MDRAEYDRHLKEIQRKLTILQQAYSRCGAKAIVALEGYDAAGKGGLLRRLGWSLDPRALRVYATAAPNGAERRQHWMKRFWTRVPENGEWAIFDRSWYGRVLVERVESLTPDESWQRAYEEINEFERVLTMEGTRVVKLLLDITPDTQLARFKARYKDPAKRWKLTIEDLRNRGRFKIYKEAYEDMLEKTDQPNAPWVRIDANHKRKARIEGLEAIYTHLARGIDLSMPATHPEIDAFFADH
ncbi:MAG: AMP phosphotransferase [Alphaproteobacteria bacterium]|nr:AMP phosphotransferase [Alphaproteobacteria bacterium]